MLCLLQPKLSQGGLWKEPVCTTWKCKPLENCSYPKPLVLHMCLLKGRGSVPICHEKELKRVPMDITAGPATKLGISCSCATGKCGAKTVAPHLGLPKTPGSTPGSATDTTRPQISHLCFSSPISGSQKSPSNSQDLQVHS